MKLILRILLFIHLGLILYGLYSILFNEEFIIASKYIFIGSTGVLVFLNTLLLFPIHLKFQNVLLLLGFLLYTLTASGFLFPIIFKNYWGVLFGGAMFLFLMSLYTYTGKILFQSKMDYLFLCGCLLSALPFIFEIKHNAFVLTTGAVLVVLTVVIVFRIFKFQSK